MPWSAHASDLIAFGVPLKYFSSSENFNLLLLPFFALYVIRLKLWHSLTVTRTHPSFLCFCLHQHKSSGLLLMFFKVNIQTWFNYVTFKRGSRTKAAQSIYSEMAVHFVLIAHTWYYLVFLMAKLKCWFFHREVVHEL